jgi:Domain of unknown function (DUF6487)
MCCVQLTCQTCHEPLLPDATLCRFCGALVTLPEPLPVAVTGVTQPLAPMQICPSCQTRMEVGFLAMPQNRLGIWWAAGELPGSKSYPRIAHADWRAIPITAYRCPSCGWIAAFAVPPQP